MIEIHVSRGDERHEKPGEIYVQLSKTARGEVVACRFDYARSIFFRDTQVASFFESLESKLPSPEHSLELQLNYQGDVDDEVLTLSLFRKKNGGYMAWSLIEPANSEAVALYQELEALPLTGKKINESLAIEQAERARAAEEAEQAERSKNS